ncbi:MAG TPA: hypothetical protein VH085_14545 [Nocardioides sp.]|jgi:hypothetical protein|nr:hypothetical protein [Nocardioides sp.]
MTAATPSEISAPPRTRTPDAAAAARDRELRSARGVADLLARRPELRGVLRTADWLEEATLWSA